MSASHFTHKAPREYVQRLEQWLGSPSVVGKDIVSWEKDDVPEPYERIYVRDEYIPHKYPAPHHDFVYSVAKIPLTAKQAGDLLKVSGSILPDLLKGEVGARCGGLKANDVTLSFAEDVSKGRAKATKAEYAKRINKGIVTRKKYDSHKKIDTTTPDECLLY